MANRNLTTEQIEYNSQQSVKFFELLYVQTRESGSSNLDHTFLTNAPYDVSVTSTQSSAMGLPAGAQEFLAIGPFLQFSDIDESADFQITSMTVSLGGLADADLFLFLGNQYIDYPIRLWRVWFDQNGIQVGDPIQIFSGKMDKPVITDDPNGGVVVGVAASSNFVDFERRAGRHTNNSEQQFIDLKFYNPVAVTANIDIGFSFAGNTITNIKWGG
jgi:hypothetical protein